MVILTDQDLLHLKEAVSEMTNVPIEEMEDLYHLTSAVEQELAGLKDMVRTKLKDQRPQS